MFEFQLSFVSSKELECKIVVQFLRPVKIISRGWIFDVLLVSLF